MGTQPNRKLAKRGSKIRSRALRNSVKSSIDQQNYKKAASDITKAVRKSGGASFLNGILAAGVIAYAASKEYRHRSPDKISGQAITKLPKNIKQDLTIAGKDSIRFALKNTLSKRSK